MMSIRLGVSGVLILLATACATVSVPDVDRNHPAHPEAEAAPLAEASAVLSRGFGSITGEGDYPASRPAAHAMDHDMEAPASRPAELDMEHQHGALGSDVLYVCPMHPEITSSEEGECPICGMYLAPVEQEDMDQGEHSHEN